MATLRAPQQGKLTLGHLVGGPEDLWRDLRQKIITEYGIDLVSHEERPKGVVSIPKSAKLIVILLDFTSKVVQKSTEKSNMPVVKIGRKRATWAKGFKQAGYVPYASLPTAPWLAVVKASKAQGELNLHDNDEEQDLSEASSTVEPPSEEAPVTALADDSLNSRMVRWTPEDVAAALRAADQTSDAEAAIALIETFTGIYRSPATLINLFRYNPGVKTEALVISLGRHADKIRQAKRHYMEKEKNLSIDELPEYVSVERANEIMGKKSRLVELRQRQKYFREYGMSMYLTVDVRDLRARYVEYHGADFATRRVVTMPKITTEEMQDRIFKALDEGPKRWTQLADFVGVDRKRSREQLEKLVTGGLVVRTLGSFGRDFFSRPEDVSKVSAMLPMPRPIRAPAKQVPQTLDPMVKYMLDKIDSDIRAGVISFKEGMDRMKILKESR